MSVEHYSSAFDDGDNRGLPPSAVAWVAGLHPDERLDTLAQVVATEGAPDGVDQVAAVKVLRALSRISWLEVGDIDRALAVDFATNLIGDLSLGLEVRERRRRG